MDTDFYWEEDFGYISIMDDVSCLSELNLQLIKNEYF